MAELASFLKLFLGVSFMSLRLPILWIIRKCFLPANPQLDNERPRQ
jgi:hypothetical protein